VAFTLTSYNVLASSYIKPGFYPRTPPNVLEPAWRIPALVRHVVALESDVLCLQEVEQDTFDALRIALEPLGYEGHDARKGLGKPDGCATFFRSSMFKLKHVKRLEYADGNGLEPDSGHVALVVALEFEGRTVAVANTHLKFDPPGAPLSERRGHRQITQWLNERDQLVPDADAWIVCGDFNVTPQNDVITVLHDAGLEYAHRGMDAPTCNSNDRAKMIDYVFHDSGLRSVPIQPPRIDDLTPLPSRDQPSDHLALSAQLEWVA
jgi:mRNA deadenylase 3'-5' endonuclease subunit Ccr4